MLDALLHRLDLVFRGDAPLGELDRLLVAEAGPLAEQIADRHARTLVCETLRAQLVERPIGLVEAGQAHAVEDTRGLRELDVAVVDDLPVVPEGVEEVVVPQHPGPGGARALERLIAPVDDEADVPGLVRRLSAS